MKCFCLSLLVIGAVMLNTNPAAAAPVPALDFKQLTEASQVICVGAVEGVRDLGAVEHEYGGRTLTLERKLASLRCERGLKGEVKPGDRLAVEFLGSQQYLLPYVSLEAGGVGMFFLARGEGDSYRLASPFHGRQVAVLAAPDNADAAPVLEKIEREFLNTVRKGGPPEALTALDRLFLLDSRGLVGEGEQIMRGLSNQQVREAVGGTILALRIRGGEPEALEQVRALPASVTDRHSYARWQHNLLTVIGQLRDKKALPFLNKLLVGESPALRREASRALTTLADNTSIPFLVRGLQDEDVDTSYNSLIALSRVTGKPGPGRDEFEQNRRKYVEEWKVQ